MSESWFEAIPDHSILVADIFEHTDPVYSHPDYPRDGVLGHFLAVLPPEARRIFRCVDFTHGDPPSDVGDFLGIIGTGAKGDARGIEPWRMCAKAWYREVVHPDPEVSFLGICGWHQHAVVALDGEVGDNPAGLYEVGTHEVVFAPRGDATSGKIARDPLFVGIAQRAGDRFSVNESHRQQVTQLPTGAIELARNEIGLQAYRFQDRPTWGVQWHPEMTKAALARFVAARNAHHLAPCIEETPAGPRLLQNFLMICAGIDPLAGDSVL